MAAQRPPAFRGRAGERAALDRLLADARAGRSAVLVIRAEAGMGKTALLRYAADRAPGFRLAEISGTRHSPEGVRRGYVGRIGPARGGRRGRARGAGRSRSADDGGSAARRPVTVEWHLRKVFTKLGISSRRALRDALPSREPAPA